MKRRMFVVLYYLLVNSKILFFHRYIANINQTTFNMDVVYMSSYILNTLLNCYEIP